VIKYPTLSPKTGKGLSTDIGLDLRWHGSSSNVWMDQYRLVQSSLRIFTKIWTYRGQEKLHEACSQERFPVGHDSMD
jgi:hypothetical protein